MATCGGGTAATGPCLCTMTQRELAELAFKYDKPSKCPNCPHAVLSHPAGAVASSASASASVGDLKDQKSGADLMRALCRLVGDEKWFSLQPLATMRRAQQALISLYPAMREQIDTLTPDEARRRFRSIKLHISSRTAALVQIESGYFVNGPLSGPMTRDGGRIVYDRLHTGHSAEPDPTLLVFKIFDTEKEAKIEYANISALHKPVPNPLFVNAFQPVPLRAASHESSLPSTLASGWILPMVEIGPTVVEAFSLYTGAGLPHTILFSAALSGAIVLWNCHYRSLVLRDLKPEHFLARRCYGGDRLAVEFVLCDAGSMHGSDQPLADLRAGATAAYLEATDEHAQISLAERDVRTLAISLYQMLTGSMPANWEQVCHIKELDRPHAPHYLRARYWTIATSIVFAAASATSAEDLIRLLVPIAFELEGNRFPPSKGSFPLGRWFQPHADYIQQVEAEERQPPVAAHLQAIFKAVCDLAVPRELALLIVQYAWVSLLERVKA